VIRWTSVSYLKVDLMRALIAALLICPVTAFADVADFYNGNEIYDYCRNDPFKARMYIAGALGGGMTMETWNKGRASVCFPPGITLGQVEGVICTSLENNPASRHLGASSLTLNALYTAWPCPR